MVLVVSGSGEDLLSHPTPPAPPLKIINNPTQLTAERCCRPDSPISSGFQWQSDNLASTDAKNVYIVVNEGT